MKGITAMVRRKRVNNWRVMHNQQTWLAALYHRLLHEPGLYEGRAGKERQQEDLEELFLATGSYRDTVTNLYEAAGEAVGVRQALPQMDPDVIRAEMEADRQKEGN
jgi:hypothetical protein